MYKIFIHLASGIIIKIVCPDFHTQQSQFKLMQQLITEKAEAIIGESTIIRREHIEYISLEN